jgi:hypothetical protein
LEVAEKVGEFEKVVEKAISQRQLAQSKILAPPYSTGCPGRMGLMQVPML